MAEAHQLARGNIDGVVTDTATTAAVSLAIWGTIETGKRIIPKSLPILGRFLNKAKTKAKNAALNARIKARAAVRQFSPQVQMAGVPGNIDDLRGPIKLEQRGNRGGRIQQGIDQQVEELGLTSRITPRAPRPILWRAGHHPWAKYLGGPEDQDLADLPSYLHEHFHRELDRILPRRRTKGYYMSLTPKQQAENVNLLYDFTGRFDQEFDTKILPKLLKELGN